MSRYSVLKKITQCMYFCMCVCMIYSKLNKVFYLNRRLLESQLAAGLPVILVGYHVFGNHFVQPEITVGHGFHVDAFSLGRPLQLVSITIIIHDVMSTITRIHSI